MGATASYLIFCDPAPTHLGLQTDVELLHINSKPVDATPFRIADKPNVFLNKAGVDIGPLTTELINVEADVVLEGNSTRGFRVYICIEDTPCVGVGSDPLQAVVHGGRALLNGTVRLGDQDRDCSDYLDAMLKQEADKLDAPATGLATGQTSAVAKPKETLPAGRSEKARTAAVIKNLLSR